MKTKLFAIVITAVFLAALIPMNLASGSTTTPLSFDDEPQPIDGTPGLEGKIVEWAQPDTGNTWTVIVSDDYYGGFYYQDFELVLQGVTCNIWVGLSPDVWTGGYTDERVLNGPGVDDDVFYFAYPWSWEAHIVSYRYLDGYRDYLTGAQLRAVMDEFDSKVGETCVEFFGDYDHSRIGPLGDGKVQILIFNIRDEFFYSPLTTPGFIMGYYWYFVSNINNANIIHIDTWQWYRRQGPTPDGGVGCPYIAVPYLPADCRPYGYEATVAHEFQHLIHRDNDYNELSWVNEGCSTLAQFICGYGHTTNLYWYVAYFWDTSLVIWKNNLENYGVVYLWTLYMYEHYGGQPLIWDIVHEQANGIEGWNKVLKKHKIKKSFDEIFKDWAIANYLDDTSYADGIYGYYALDLPCQASRWWDIPYSIWYWNAAYPWFDIYVDAYPNYGYNYPYGTSLPYVVNYVEFYNSAPNLEFYFDGDDYVGVIPHSGMYEWYSDGVAWSWFRLGQTFDLTGVSAATLKFWSHYDIEEDWDYGYVEVHDLNTDEWYTLPGLTTIDTVPNPQDNPNCPDDVEPTAYLAAGRWNAFTGSSGGWYQETMDLTPFAGHNIELYFTHWSDGYVNWLGWYIDDIEIPEIGFVDDVESGSDGWTYNVWYITDGISAFNNFEVEFVRTLSFNVKGEEWTEYDAISMELDDTTETGWQYVQTLSIKDFFTVVDPIVMVAANQPGYEHPFETYYWFYANIKP